MKCNPIINLDSRINKYTKNKQNKTMIMISRVVLQICTNCERNEMQNKTGVKINKDTYLAPK